MAKRPASTPRWIAGLLLAALCLPLSGCWDRSEIQERSFVLAAAVDVDEGEGNGQAAVERFANPHEQRIKVSLQVLRFGGGKAGEEKPGGETKTYLVGSTGSGTFEAVRDALGESSKGLWFENIQAVLLSEAAVKRYGLRKLLDFWRRDAEMRWRMRIFIIPGEAKPFLEFAPPTGEPGGIFFANLARRQIKDTHLPTARTDLSFISQALDNQGDLILPVLEKSGKNVKIKGAALFKGEQFATYIDEYTIKGIRFARMTEKSGLITFECPIHPGNMVTFELFRHTSILKPRVEGDKVYFTLDIALRGNLGEAQCEHQHDTTSVEYQQKAKRLIADEIKRNIEHSVAFCQALGIDLFEFKARLRAYEPKTWSRLENDWEKVYPTIPLIISVNVAIINVGEHR